MKNINKTVKFTAKWGAILAIMLIFTPSAFANDDNRCRNDASVNVRSLNDFLEAQGTSFDFATTSEFSPPVPDQVGWVDNPAITFAWFDYTGFANKYIMQNGGKSLSTNVRGTVFERSTQGGHTEVHVRLFTTNALAWAFKLEDADFEHDPLPFLNTPLAFGARADDVLNGAKPALAVSYFDVKFRNTGRCAPFPDLVQLVNSPEPSQTPYSFTFLAWAYGKSDGKPALLRVEQICTNNGSGQTCEKEVVTIIK